jgi:c-di-GMP-binding flagellar brake protein YcgR
VQLREYVRVGTELDMRVFTKKGNREIEIVKKGNENISGSGMQFHSAEHVAADSELKIFLNTVHGVTVVIHSTVVRCSHDNDNGIYTIAVRFIRIADETRDKILQLILTAIGKRLSQSSFEECILLG